MRAVIFANGELNDLEAAKADIQASDLFIASDGGARYCLALGLTPDAVIGDFDSISKIDLQTLETAGSHIIRHPTRKDETDLELALLHAQTLGAEEVLVLGGLGGRWDQSLANILLPTHPKLSGLKITFLEGSQRIFLVTDEITFSGLPGDTVSLIPVGGDVIGITTTGLEYPLVDEALYFGETRGVSNVLDGREASVKVQAGQLICVVISQ